MASKNLTQQQFEAQAQALVNADSNTFPNLAAAESYLRDHGIMPQGNVFMGGTMTGPLTTYGRQPGMEGLPGHQATQPVPNVQPQDAANYWLQQQFDQQTPAWARIHKEMLDAGVIQKNTPFWDIMNVWGNAVGLAAMAYQNDPTSRFTPEHYIQAQAALNGGLGGKTTTRSTSTSKPPSALDLQAGYQSVAEQALGRRATAAEAATAAGKVRSLYQANPATSVTTSTTDAQGNTVSSNVGNPGLGSAGANEAFLQNAMSSKDYGAYQAAGRLFPLLQNALAAVNSAGQ